MNDTSSINFALVHETKALDELNDKIRVTITAIHSGELVEKTDTITLQNYIEYKKTIKTNDVIRFSEFKTINEDILLMQEAIAYQAKKNDDLRQSLVKQRAEIGARSAAIEVLQKKLEIARGAKVYNFPEAKI